MTSDVFQRQPPFFVLVCHECATSAPQWTSTGPLAKPTDACDSTADRLRRVTVEVTPTGLKGRPDRHNPVRPTKRASSPSRPAWSQRGDIVVPRSLTCETTATPLTAIQPRRSHSSADASEVTTAARTAGSRPGRRHPSRRSDSRAVYRRRGAMPLRPVPRTVALPHHLPRWECDHPPLHRRCSCGRPAPNQMGNQAPPHQPCTNFAYHDSDGPAHRSAEWQAHRP